MTLAHHLSHLTLSGTLNQQEDRSMMTTVTRVP